MNSNNLHTFVILAYKKSKYLENCIKSVLNQEYSSNVLIATTTNNDHIKTLANKYHLKIIEGKHTNIGGDFDFAKNCANTDLITIAHQDDVYDREYSKEIIKAYKKWDNSIIIFTDYYEIRKSQNFYTNTNLKIKRILLFPLRFTKLSKYKFIKRLALRFGDSISCPAVTFTNKNVPKNLFTSHFKANVDWFAWEKLSNKKGRFVFINKILMGHRISESSETTKIINSGERTKEDLEIFKKFWPSSIAKILTKKYQNGERQNKL